MGPQLSGGKPLVLDTCVLVDFLRGHRQAVSFVLAHQNEIILSPIVIAELHAGARNEGEITELDRLPRLFPAVPVSIEIARLCGTYMGRYSKSHALRLGDAILAATASTYDAILSTLNVKHFPMFEGLKPAYKG